MIHLFKRVYVARGWEFRKQKCFQQFLTREPYEYRYPEEEDGLFNWWDVKRDPIFEVFGTDIAGWLKTLIELDKKVIFYFDDSDYYRILGVHYKGLFPGIEDLQLFELLSLIEFNDNPIYRGGHLANNPYALGANFKLTMEFCDSIVEKPVEGYLDKIGAENISTELVMVNFIRNPEKWRTILQNKLRLFCKDTVHYVQENLHRDIAKMGIRLGLATDGRLWYPSEYEDKISSDPNVSWILSGIGAVKEGKFDELLTPELVLNLAENYVLKSRVFYNKDLGTSFDLNRYIDWSTYADLYPAVYHEDIDELIRLMVDRGAFVTVSSNDKINEFLAENLIKMALTDTPLIDQILI